MLWCRCGEQGVVLSCETSLRVVPCREDNLSFLQVGPCHLIQEQDCVRIISLSSHELIQRVPQVVVDIFRINSTSPGSYLLEASKQFQVRLHHLLCEEGEIIWTFSITEQKMDLLRHFNFIKPSICQAPNHNKIILIGITLSHKHLMKHMNIN